ncbi:Y-family DNA polymerase [Allosphingosinicella vermicomposti]|uniref:Y-family DNA polymerase n=1 Tax=Allosphingosinicella vermicomposti TaxID=614671 RepID=UPI001FE14B40|nr:DNA polymerase Y family protein [Allosphingosinicella vermicomposti]
MTQDPSGNRRYLAVWFPFLPADRLRLEERSPAPPEGPRVFVHKVKGAMRIAAVDARALELGLTPGLGLADARARVPDLDARDMMPDRDRALLERIADGCERYTPMIAIDGEDALVLDITGCAHLYEDERGLAGHLLNSLSPLGERELSLRLALANTPDKALALARFGWKGATPNDLPVAALQASPQTETALRRAGLKTIGDLATRPSAPLAARFGSALVTRLARILGEEDARITPRRAPPPIIVHRRFAEPVARVDDMLAALEALLGEAGEEMERRHKGGRRFDAALFRTDGKVMRLSIETGHPARAPAPMMRLFRERIDALRDPIDPGFGFDLIRLSVPVIEPLAPSSPSLDGEEEKMENGIDSLIDRLSTRLGRTRVTRFLPYDTHIPEQAAFEAPAVDRRPATWDQPEAGEPPHRPLHLLHPPQLIDVTAEVPDGPPRRFRWRQTMHQVAKSEGPERIAAEWWRRADGKGLTRDYYRVEDMDGRRFWLFRHGLYGAEKAHPDWYIHGLFA